jgi:hypothetical protein
MTPLVDVAVGGGVQGGGGGRISKKLKYLFCSVGYINKQRQTRWPITETTTIAAKPR